MLGLAFRYAGRELRGGLKGFRVFLACLAMGVAAIAGVGSVSTAILEGLRADGKSLLGGDVDLRLTHRAATEEQLTWLQENTDRLSAVATMRAMAIRADGEDRKLIELKAVDAAYPLHGDVVLESGGPIQDRLAKSGDAWGSVVSSRLIPRLGLQNGSEIRIGDATFAVSDILVEEPDKSTRAFELGPRVIVPSAALAATGLEQPGSLIQYHYRVIVPAGETPTAWIDRLHERFPEAGWRVRGLDNAAPNIQRFVDRVTMFLTLVGLTALLVGGVGVGNAVKAFLQARTGTIATLKCLGAPSSTIFSIYLIQVMLLASVGIVAGLVIGTVAPLAAAPFIADRLPIDAQIGIYPDTLVMAAVFGFLVTFLFALLPLARARTVPAATLFRDLLTPVTGRPGPRVIALLISSGLVLAGLAVLTADNWKIAGIFVVGSAAALLAFRLTAEGVMALARKLPRSRNAKMRLAVANLHRPGAPTGSVVVSLGLGLTVLVTVALIEGNLSNQLNDTLRGEAPGFYFIDIQPDQTEAFDELVGDFPTLTKSDRVPMLRGRITALDGVPVSEIEPDPDFAWILRGDRGFTWSPKPPEAGSEVVAGEWWPEDYKGDPLVSFDAAAAKAFGLEVGDTISVNLLGRGFTAEIANLRKIDWTSLGINFVMVFSPGLMEQAPQTYIATAYLDEAQEPALEALVTDAFPNVSSVRVKEVLEGVDEIVGNLAVAVRSIAAVAIVAGVLVLAGAIAAGHARRVYESVVLKVLGATRKDVAVAFLIEYGLMGVVTALIAAAVGSVAAWGVITFVMRADWIFVPMALISTVLLSVAITTGLGLAGTWVALGRKAAPLLRNE
ncbi:MAG: FtsX-like permease family protein [Alphaproteobacteria bacterium]